MRIRILIIIYVGQRLCIVFLRNPPIVMNYPIVQVADVYYYNVALVLVSYIQARVQYARNDKGPFLA